MKPEENLDAIKLIIFDLDETLWNGVLSDGTAIFQQNRRQLLEDIVDAGVVLSICSKNDEDTTKEYLKTLGLLDFFVFVSINWSPKGARVKQIIMEMQLREPNVLFVDDNSTNRAEVLDACPEIAIADIDIIPHLEQYYRKTLKKDKERKRLKQYRILEEKSRFKAKTGSNEEFLRNCNIRVEIFHDCVKKIERIYELVMRSNQLNFTKQRPTMEELKSCIEFSDDAGYVSVKDNFGDYGIVGFYVVRDRSLVHFVFSCRTLNMGVEQYVYRQLGCPLLNIVGDVASSPQTPTPDWINQDTYGFMKGQNSGLISSSKTNLGKIILKGPCDLEQIYGFIHSNAMIKTEFTYLDESGVSIEGHNHTEMILEAKILNKSQKSHLLKLLPWGNERMLSTGIFDSDVSSVVFSTFTDPNLGLYRHKNGGEIIAFGEYVNNLTNPEQWNDLIENRVFTSHFKFTKEFLQDFSVNFEYMGRISPDKVLDNLKSIRALMSPSARLVLILGSEMPYERNQQLSYADRHLYHQELNSKIKEWIRTVDNVFALDVNEFIDGQSCFTNNINHFQKQIYYHLTKKLLTIIDSKDVSSKSMLYYQLGSFTSRTLRWLKRHLIK